MDNSRNSITQFFEHSPVVSFLILFLIFCACIASLMIPEDSYAAGLSYGEGQKITQTVYAKCDFDSVDVKKTEEKRKNAKMSVPVYYQRSDYDSGRIFQKFSLFFDEIARRAEAEKKGKTYVEEPEIVAKGASDVCDVVKSLTPAEFKFFCRIQDDREYKRKEEILQKIKNQILNSGVLKDHEKKDFANDKKVVVYDIQDGVTRKYDPGLFSDLHTPATAGQSAVMFFLPQNDISSSDVLPADHRDRFGKLFARFFTDGNLKANQAKTQEEEKIAYDRVKDIFVTFHRGDEILRKGELFKKEQIQKLDDYKEALEKKFARQKSLEKIAGKAALCLLFIIFTCLYVLNIHPDIVKDNRAICFFGGIIILSLLLNYLAGCIFNSLSFDKGIPPQLMFVALPLALPALVICPVYGLRAGVFVGMFVSGIAAVSLNMEESFSVLVTGLFVNAVVGRAVRNVSNYERFFTMAFLATAIATAISGFIFIYNDFTFFNWDVFKNNWTFWRDAFVFFAAVAFVTATLANLILYCLRFFFGILTNMSYLTLVDRNNELLKRLQFEAPGTYHHSERVASIAEAAAGVVGASSIKLQACALFHDLGKLKHPATFTENGSADEPLKGLTPEQCAARIREHVTHGIELAKKYKLVRPIRDSILQHHGTDFISFFYEKAKSENPDNPPNPELFQYPGPKPQTKEAVILSIADCAEAVSRSIPNPTEEKLSKKLKEIIFKRLENGQFDEAPVTIAEIRKICDSVVESLAHMSNVRIAYPVFDKKQTDEK